MSNPRPTPGGRAPVRLLYLCASLTAGGAERLVHGLTEYLDRERFSVSICALSVVGGNSFQREFERLGVPVYVIGATTMFTPRVYRALARHIREQRIEFIHTHLTSADFVGRLVGRALGVPVISTMHNIPQDYEGEKPQRYWPERITAHTMAAHLIAVSERIRQMYIQRWRLPPERITTIVNGAPIEPFLAVPAGVPARGPGEGPLITNVARLSRQKAQHNLLEAARIVLAARPDARFQLVGRGDREAALKEQAHSLGIAERITFAGVRHDIPAILGASDIFVLSSDWEGMPVSAIEAMAAARPVVLTDVGGVRDLIADEAHGLLVPPGDPEALARAILGLLADDGRRAAMGLAGRELVRHTFNMERFARRHEELYERILAEHRGAPRSRRPAGAGG